MKQIVEDCEERMSSSIVDEILEIVKNTLPPPPENAEEEKENAETEEGTLSQITLNFPKQVVASKGTFTVQGNNGY